MTPEKLFFLQCLKDFCNNILSNEPDPQIDMNQVMALAHKHSLTVIILYQCSDWIHSRCSKEKLDGIINGTIFLSLNRRELLREITDRFNKENIDFVCMKGSVFRDYYPVPDIREMGDIDIIIHQQDRNKSDRILREEMRFDRMIDNHNVWAYGVRQFAFEIHDHMFYENLANHVDYRTYFDKVWGTAHPGKVFGIEADNLYVPDENLHFLYLMTHTAKHIINSGSGFRAFLDMVMISRASDTRLDWGWIRHELEELELLDFTRNCFAFCKRWFGVKMPLEAAEISDEFYDRITEKIFNDGIFGLENEENREAKPAKSISRSKAPYSIAAVKYAVSQVFPSYSNMQLIPWYSWVDGMPWLLPAAWIYRWGYCLVHKGERSKTVISEPFTKKGKIEKREQQIREWGL